MSKHFILPDVQVTPKHSFNWLKKIGQHVVDERPDVIICLGDFWDMNSLSSYDKGTVNAEGKRVSDDIVAGKKAMQVFLKPLRDLQKQQRKNKHKVYHPRMVFLIGNHEERIMRHVKYNPELQGFLSYDSLELEQDGWEVYDFLKPVKIDGVAYSHYFTNPFTGRAMGGSVQNMLKQIGQSFVMGHKQVLEYTTRGLPTGQMQHGIIIGACYKHDEGYKGHQGNTHFRGYAVLDRVKDGDFSPSFHSIM